MGKVPVALRVISLDPQFDLDKLAAGEFPRECLATKGSSDLDMCYTNVAEGAPWSATIHASLPWDSENPPTTLSKLPGFDIRMLGLDILHIFHLGVGRGLLSSAIRVCGRLRFWTAILSKL